VPTSALLVSLALAAAASPRDLPPAASDSVLTTLQAELERLAADLRKAPVPIYFLSYQLTDSASFQISSSFGALSSSRQQESRSLDVDLRVGGHALDNTHPVRGEGMGADFAGAPAARQLPLDGDPQALRAAVWLETESAYRAAVQRFEKVKANVGVKAAQEDRSGDFSPAEAETHLEPSAPFSLDAPAWERRLRALTAPFAGHPAITHAAAHFSAERETRRYVSTEGSRIQTSSPFYRLAIAATAKAADGMELPLQATFMSFRPDGLPGDEALEREVARMIETLLALVKAPVADPYTGPAILSGRAAAVFFHETFGHRIEGQRQKNEEEAQTFRKKLGQPVLPPFLSVASDPTLRQVGNVELVGHYPYDDEGVKARRVTLVKGGVLQGFLMSRAPVEGFPRSNGHGRRQQGNRVVARQSSLLVEASRTVPRAELKRQLLKRIRAARKAYGLLFDDIEGGFTFTARIVPNAFNVRPTVVYRIHADGREELVRGVDLIGTPLIAFSKIAAAGDDPAVFNGVCGAESGWVPVSAVAPSLLLAQIEVQRKEKSQELAPVLPAPPSLQGR